jgi:capsular polysaccharide biosynthesis protein
LLKNYALRRGAAGIPSGLWVIDNYSPSYHHWMVDVLPRILRAEECHPDARVLLLPRYYESSPYIDFTLQAFPRIERVGWISDRRKTRVAELAWIPRQTDRLFEQLAEIARRVGALAGEPGDARRIYITRAADRWRRARNEADVIRELRAHGFEIVQIDAAKPWEGVRTAMGAKVIAGVHGAGLTNLIFLRPGGCVIEFRHRYDDLFFNAYRPLAEGLGLEYRGQKCESAFEGDGPAINKANIIEINMGDLVIDLDALRETLRALPE